jgi:hypothetical protein
VTLTLIDRRPDQPVAGHGGASHRNKQGKEEMQ